MSQLDALLARSRTPGTFVEKRSFTLARSKAIEKMREFSLRDPDQAVLELVQAAVFAGARWIAVDTSPDALLVAWVGGRSLGRTDLEELFDYLFADQGHAETRYLMQTAIGVNALLQGKPRTLRIESGDGSSTGTARMDLDQRGRGEVGLPESGLAGTYLYCEAGGGWLGRFVGGDASARRSQLVETRCLYTPTPILLNGSAPFGYRSSDTVQLFGVIKGGNVTGGGRRGAIGVPHASVQPGLRLVVGGVWVTTRTETPLGDDLVGVIGDDRLRKTADMSDIVEDARWIDLLHDVQPLATRLLKEVKGQDYRAPRLPPRIVEQRRTEQSPVEELEPVEDPLVQVAPRQPVALELLDAMGPDEPLFWVEEDVLDELTAAVDPVAFPYRVLVLTPGQARTLQATLGSDGPALSRLTNPEDVSFVRHAMERRHHTHTVRLEAEVHLAGETSPRVIPLELRLHLQGGLPFWDTSSASGGVPLALVRQGRTTSCARLDLPLHDVSVVADLSSQPPHASGLMSALRTAVQRESWRLLPSEDLKDEPWRSRLELALLADHARPHLVREHGAASPRLGVRFPAAWRAVADRLLQSPLIRTREGPLTLADLAALQGTSEVRWLSDPADRLRIEPLEAHFGFGHLALPEDLSTPLAAVGRTLQSWTTRAAMNLADPALSELLLVFAALTTPAAPPGWRALEEPAPGIARWIRTDEPESAGSIREAAALLTQHLNGLDAADWRQRPPHTSEARARALGRLAALRLACLSDRLGDVRLSDAQGRVKAVSLWLRDPELRLVARGGATARMNGVVPVSLDELHALAGAPRGEGSAPLPLLLDDHPELWDTAGSEHSWLVRTPIHQAGLRGWLGLREPFDPTPAVLLEVQDRLEVLPAFTARVPCHGLLHLTGELQLSTTQQELLNFAGMQLYQQLLHRMDEDLSPVHRAAAHAYAARFAHRAAQRQGSLRAGLPRSLAQRVPVVDAQGADWGTLVDWLAAPADARPPPPPGVDVQPVHQRTGQVDRLDDADEVWGFLTGPLDRAIGAQLPGVRCSITEGLTGSQLAVLDSTDATRCRLHLQRTPLATQALVGDARARGLLLVEASRVALQWATRCQHRLDPLALQQAVLAAHLAR